MHRSDKEEQPSYEVNRYNFACYFYDSKIKLTIISCRRYKRSYGGSYQTKGYGSGSYGKLNEGYQNGAQLGMQCYALARTATNKWCYDNCLQGFCPKHVCSCTGELYNRALKPTYDSYGKSGQYVKPSYGQSGYVKPSYGQQSTGSYQSTYGQSSFNQPKYGQSGGSYGQKTYADSDYSKTNSFGGYQKTGYQTQQQIEPRQYGQFEQQKTQF